MPKRSEIVPAKRREWFKRFEEDGESAAEIARDVGYDVRTVRKQIELTRQERESREARSTVLRQGLEKHYDDLILFAKKLDAGILASPIPSDVKNDRMWRALYEHLPHSRLWKMIGNIDKLNDRVRDTYQRAEERLRAKVTKESSIGLVSRPGEIGIFDNALTGAMNYHLEANDPCPLLEFTTSNINKGLVEVHYGAWSCCRSH